MWFGKKAAEDAVKGVGSWIDEQQFTPQEQLDAKLKLFEVMGPFKQIQRIIVTWVMHVWSFLALNFAVVYWYSLATGKWIAVDKFIEMVMTPFIWAPCFGVFSLYLYGGLKNAPFMGKK